MERTSLDYGVELHVHYNLEIFAPTKCLWKHFTDDGVGTARTCAVLLSGRCWFLHPTRIFKIITQPKCFTPIAIKRPLLNEFIPAYVIKRALLSFHSGVAEFSVFLGMGRRHSRLLVPDFRHNLVVTSSRAVNNVLTLEDETSSWQFLIC